MSETLPSSHPKKEVIAPPHESLRAEFAEEPVAAELSYGEARLWIIARDPHCIFAYWEFRPDEHPDAVDVEGPARFFLRIFHEDGRPESRTEVADGVGNCFMHAGAADAGYYAELGFYSNNVWCFLARSKNIHTPPELPTADAPVAFATLPSTVSLSKMRDLLASSSLPGESLASTAARIQAAARASDHWTAESERLLTDLLAEATGPDLVSPASSATLVRRKLAVAAKIAAPMPPIPAPETGNAPSSWPTSPGAAPR